jgi:hypothetical protein
MPWGPAVYEKLDAPIRSRASRWVGRQLCKRRAEFLEFHPALLLGRRFQAIDVTIGGVFDFAASPAPCPNQLSPIIVGFGRSFAAEPQRRGCVGRVG